MPEGIEAATGGHRRHPRLEGREKKGVVTAQGMPDDADPVRVDFRQRLQQVDGPPMVEDALHGGAGVAHGVGIDLVVPEPGVVGRQGDVAPPGQLQGIVQVGLAAQPRRFGLADGGGLVEAKDGGTRFPLRQPIGNQQIGRNAVRFSLHHLADEGDLPPLDLRQLLGFQDLDLQRIVGKPGKRPHDLLHVLEDVDSANVPVGAALYRMRSALAVQVVKQIPLVRVDRGLRGRAGGQPQDHRGEAEETRGHPSRLISVVSHRTSRQALPVIAGWPPADRRSGRPSAGG